MKGNMVILSAILLFLLLFAGACTHKPVHPTKSDREWGADHKACEKWARDMIRDDPYSYDDLDEMKMIKSCMQRKGWTWGRSDWFKSKTDSAQ